MNERPAQIACQVCGVTVAVGARGPVPAFCTDCVEIASRLGQLQRAVATVRDRLSAEGQAKLRRYMTSQIFHWLNADLNRHKWLRGKPCDKAARTATVTPEVPA